MLCTTPVWLSNTLLAPDKNEYGSAALDPYRAKPSFVDKNFNSLGIGGTTPR